MDSKDFRVFHELVEQFSGEMTLAEICRCECVDYRSYISWRSRMGYARPRKKPIPTGMVEAEITDVPIIKNNPHGSYARARLCIEFENGLKLERESMEAEALIDFLQKLRPVLCLS